MHFFHSGNDCSTGTSNKYYWTQALQLGGSSFSSYSDWRLPNKKERAITMIGVSAIFPLIRSVVLAGLSQ
jgi:hypothetical protein